ncbi:MAG: membrane protein insertase YidC [Alphaproteobacteria bacterium]|nr:membrane protein insertase YidC [Alphaproteobacteria bacterium]
MQEDVKRLYATLLVAIVALFIFNKMFPQKPIPTEEEKTTEVVEIQKEPELKQDNKVIEDIQAPALSVAKVLKNDARLTLENKDLRGSIRLKGARFDSLYLKKYKQTLESDSNEVELLTPSKTETPYYAELGWVSPDNSVNVPNAQSVWTVKQSSLTDNSPVTLEWDNGQGLKFIRRITLDNAYLFKIQQSVENNTNKEVTLYPYALINRKIETTDLPSSVVHEGMIGVLDDNLQEIKYKDLKDNSHKSFKTTDGWFGFSDRYWFTTFILNDEQTHTVKYTQTKENTFQADYIGEAIKIQPKSCLSNDIMLYAGAKEIKLLDKYKKTYNISKFDLAVDFGWYYFLTKPFFYILDFLYRFIGNMGWAILLFAALLRLLMFPIANKSFESMSKMKKVQPKMTALQEMYKDDKVALQKATMELYRKEKINPAAGCLPMLIQIPVFFSLYKVLNIAIEIRHAPFVGWIKDLSAPDPLVISQWSHLPIPGLLDIGIWPIIMGLTMFLQQKLSPAPANKDQARAFMFMPLIFTFMLGHFASGLVIYWTLSNVLALIQQKAIMAKNGVK